MEIKINLDEIFSNGASVEEAVKNEVIDILTNTIGKGIERQINEEVSKVINEQIATAITAKMPEIINDLLNSQYVQVDRWGDAKGMTTFRQELVKAINEQMIYKKTTYSSDRNHFTKAVDSVIEQNINQFKNDFTALVNAQFCEEALQYATEALRKRLKI